MRYIIYSGLALAFAVFAFLQNSFFSIVPSPNVYITASFIFFYTLIFFDNSGTYKSSIIYALSAGLFSDLFSTNYFGTSLILFLFLGFLITKLKEYIQEKQQSRPYLFFLPMFLFSLFVYSFVLILLSSNFSLYTALSIVATVHFLFIMILNSAIASVVFLAVNKVRKMFRIISVSAY